jgi:chloramphenicol 3-O-phosphotransferase
VNVNHDELMVIVITGPVGSGKSTSAWALHDMLAEERITTALIDMDYLRCAWPQVSVWNQQLGYDNFAAIAINHQAIGVRCFIVADVVETLEQRFDYANAVPGSRVIIVRLNVPLDVVSLRLHGRETAASLEWHLTRAPQIQETLIRNGIGDIVVDVTDHAPRDVAREIFERLELHKRTRWSTDT